MTKRIALATVAIVVARAPERLGRESDDPSGRSKRPASVPAGVGWAPQALKPFFFHSKIRVDRFTDDR